MKAELDHLAIVAAPLAAGVASVEDALGVTMAPGGEHPLMGTHNRLLSLGPDEYLEVIAIDPKAPAPGRARWFGLDGLAGRPLPGAWVVRVPDLDAALERAPDGAGVPLDLSRGDLRWRMAVPESGVLPFDGLFPALIAWQAAAHPAPRLPDLGLRLCALRVGHPRAAALRAALVPVIQDSRIEVVEGASPALEVVFDTPAGRRRLV
jgi:hypothetical protein